MQRIGSICAHAVIELLDLGVIISNNLVLAGLGMAVTKFSCITTEMGKTHENT